MLAISDSAAEAIRGLAAAPVVPDGAGLRITAPAHGAAVVRALGGGHPRRG